MTIVRCSLPRRCSKKNDKAPDSFHPSDVTIEATIALVLWGDEYQACRRDDCGHE